MDLPTHCAQRLVIVSTADDYPWQAITAVNAPGASVVEMVEAILLDKRKILPCSVFLQGEYGVRDLFVGVPCKLGAKGLEKIIEIKLTADEDAAFKKSAAAVKELVDVIKV